MTTSFTFHIFVAPELDLRGRNHAWVDLIMALHGKQVAWPQIPPSTALAKLRYQRTLLKRFAVVRRLLPPPSGPGRRLSSPSASIPTPKRPRLLSVPSEEPGQDDSSE